MRRTHLQDTAWTECVSFLLYQIGPRAALTRIDEPLAVRGNIRLVGYRLLEVEHGLVCGDGYLELELAGAWREDEAGEGAGRRGTARTLDIDLYF